MAPARVALLMSCLVVVRLAVAEPRQTGWSFTPLVGTDVGLDLAAGFQLEMPSRVRLMATVGWTPRTYAWALKRVFLVTHDEREAMGNLLQEISEHALVVGGNLTLRPIAHRGLFAGAGYHLELVDKQGLFAGQIENAIGQRLEGTGRSVASRTFDLDAHVHVAEALLGWQWGLGSGFMVRASVGLLVIVSTSTTFEPAFTPSDPARTMQFTDAASDAVDDAGTGTFAPFTSLFLGYTFD